MLKNLFELLGFQLDTTAHKEKLISALGGFCAIFMIFLLTSHYVKGPESHLIIASMGASAVLLFAVPHGPLSQPWPVFGGHLISATIGVSAALLINNTVLAAALAVGLSIGVMYYLRCIHPPGGATALSAVVGGSQIHQLGFDFLVTPVLLNVAIILCVAVLFNLPFAWRRYPALYAKVSKNESCEKAQQIGRIPRKDLEFALKSMQSFTDISELELERIYQTATSHQLSRHLSIEDIKLGHYYLHGRSNGKGVIRRVIDESADHKDMLIYKVITGPENGKTQVASRENFSRWAQHEVSFENGEWLIK
jgi:CBS-domain-containing membrane protein